MGARGKGITFQWLLDRVAYQGDDCLPWPFCKDGSVGRGRIVHLGVSWWAHRLMCFLAHGNPPTRRHQAAHNCGNGHLACVNQRHLEWKTNTQNQLDRTLHGTKRIGGIPRNKLTAEQVDQIRALKGTKTQYELAEMFGVKRGTIEYWLRKDRPPTPLSDNPSAIRRRIRSLSDYRGAHPVCGAAMIEDDIPDNPYMTDPDGDWTSRIGKGFVVAIIMTALGLFAAWLLGLAWNWG